MEPPLKLWWQNKIDRIGTRWFYNAVDWFSNDYAIYWIALGWGEYQVETKGDTIKPALEVPDTQKRSDHWKFLFVEPAVPIGKTHRSLEDPLLDCCCGKTSTVISGGKVLLSGAGVAFHKRR